MSAFLVLVYNVGSHNSTKLYQPIDLNFMSVDMGCINSLLLLDLFLSTSNHPLENGSRKPSEYLGSCSN